MADRYTVIGKSRGKLEIQGLVYSWSSSSAIIEAATVGSKYYDPNTDRLNTLVGQKEYQDIDLTGVLSRNQFVALRRLFTSEQSSSGELVATHSIGEIITVLTGVKILSLEYGDFDKTSSDVAEVKVKISYSSVGTDATTTV